MRRPLLLLGALLALSWLCAPFAHGQAPVTLDKSEYYINVLQDGRLQVTHELTFTDLEGGRDRIFPLWSLLIR
jgi:hypothetical protein